MSEEFEESVPPLVPGEELYKYVFRVKIPSLKFEAPVWYVYARSREEAERELNHHFSNMIDKSRSETYTFELVDRTHW